MQSILRTEKGRCYICEELYQDFSAKQTEEHHIIFGYGQRELSERYGLKVYLCLWHHRLAAGRDKYEREGCKDLTAVHRDIILDRWLKERAQRAFESFYPKLSFREVFGISFDPYAKENYSRKDEKDGFVLTDDEEEIP